jgi:hypothetical protein
MLFNGAIGMANAQHDFGESLRAQRRLGGRYRLLLRLLR